MQISQIEIQYEKTINNLKGDLERKQEDMMSKQQENQKKIEDLNANVKDLLKTLESSQKEINRLEKKCDDQILELREAKEHIREAKEQLNNSQEQRAQLEQEIELIRENRHVNHETEIALQQKIEIANEKISDYEKENSGLKYEMELLKGDVDKLQISYRNSALENQHLQSTIKSLVSYHISYFHNDSNFILQTRTNEELVDENNKLLKEIEELKDLLKVSIFCLFDLRNANPY
jgi:chromosome segregation ATPase